MRATGCATARSIVHTEQRAEPFDASGDIMAPEENWPNVPDDIADKEAAKLARYQARLDLYAARLKDDDGEVEGRGKYYDALFEVGKGSIDRRRSGASTVQTAAAAIATLYTGVLAVSFSVADHPLPPRGLISPFFLGLAIVLSTFFLAYVSQSGVSEGATTAPDTEERELKRINAFLDWVKAAGTANRWAVNAGVVALGVGLVFLPAAFITLDPQPSSDLAKWPKPPVVLDEHQVPLQQVILQAQVDEVTADRKPRPSVESSTGNVIWGFSAALGAALVVLVPIGLNRRFDANGGSTAQWDGLGWALAILFGLLTLLFSILLTTR